MKRTLTKTALGLLMLGSLGMTAPAALASWDHGHDYAAHRQSQHFSQQVNARQERQRERILAGRHEGHLTRAEFHKLMHEQREIRSMERHFRADGIIDHHEFRRLDHALDQASRNIRMEKRDHQEHQAYQGRGWYN